MALGLADDAEARVHVEPVGGLVVGPAAEHDGRVVGLDEGEEPSSDALSLVGGQDAQADQVR